MRVLADPHSGDRGSASVLVALWAVVLTMLASGGIVLTSVLAARVSVSSAADLAALAGATATLDDPRVACTRAQEVAQANGVTLTECRVGGTEVWVQARAPAPGAVDWLVPGRGTHIGARAHAELAAEDP
ncbi:MAG TPA: Rv3654c family TadE-like protein [Motilibacterales bacterium]|nr:Rv3654c family TadE-like protein [Motilibacterales bacterium]